MIPFYQLAETAILASIEAGNKIIEIYDSNNFDVVTKDDNSPLTQADMASHKIIAGYLSKTGYNILSEEEKNIPYSTRKNWNSYWLVDPLDGTKEFINKNGEFTVNIAFIMQNKPSLGVIYTPVTRDLYFSIPKEGAYKKENVEYNSIENKNLNYLIKKSKKMPFVPSMEKISIVGSRSHSSEATKKFIADLERKYGQLNIIIKGSSLKLCMVAEGTADIYPRFGPTMEWDIAAGHAIAKEAGCIIEEYPHGNPLLFNKENLLNPWFIVKNDKLNGLGLFI